MEGQSTEAVLTWVFWRDQADRGQGWSLDDPEGAVRGLTVVLTGRGVQLQRKALC